MSDPAQKRINKGANKHPFSGVGIEYYPLGSSIDKTDLLIHEVGFLPENSNWNFSGVFSPFWRLIYNSEPGHSIEFRNKSYDLVPDEIALVPDNQLLQFIGPNPVPTFWIAFSIRYSIAPDQPVPITLEPSPVHHKIISNISQLVTENVTFEPVESIYRLSHALLNILLTCLDIKWKKNFPPVLLRVLRHIGLNYASALPNSHLAEIACLSIEGLSKMFRNHLNISPAAYVTQTRIKESSRFLLETNESIDRIASATGFPNRNYFSRVFKKVTNESPAEFRKLNKEI